MKNLLLLLFLCHLTLALQANNIQVNNVSRTTFDATAKYAMVEFDLSWDNSWRTSVGPANWDAAWVFVKFRVGSVNPVLTGASSSGTTVTVSSTARLRVGMPVVVTSGTGAFAANTVISSITNGTDFVVSASPSTALSNATIECVRIWEHAYLDTTDANHSAPSGSTIAVPNDSTGAFIYRSQNGYGSFSLTDVALRWKYGSNGLDLDSVFIKVFAIEMVYVPQASFVVGSGGSNTSEFYTHTTNVPFQISSENAITVGTNSGDLYYPSSTYGGDQSGPIPAAFPKGYAGFYCMKYEISQGQYRDFLNTLTYTQQTSRAVNVTGGAGTAALSNSNRNGIDIQTPGVAASFTPAVYACNLDGDGNYNETVDGEWIACNWLSWMDGAAYLDWAGLRPMTELEFEKACRGEQAAVADEYAWGSASITGATGLSNGGTNNETFSNSGANCAFNNGTSGPMRTGAFAGGATSRAQSGGSYYGIMELSGNVWERSVTLGNTTGREFTGLHGDGSLSSGGHANTSKWPGLSSNEVTDAIGSGSNGGAWNSNASFSFTVVSNRVYSALNWTSRSSGHGGRGVRSAP